tara:strand:- start:1503 stop:2168 length:666 start_codon:yes stop_codon:yes gene_type:complete
MALDIPNLANKLTVTRSLASFYDDIVYWEMAKGANRFFVTFEKGRHGIPNNKIESIGTSEITYPHVNSNTGSSNTFALGATRNVARYDTFLEEEEKFDGNNHSYNGYITNTELKGTRFFQTTLTSSQFQPTEFNYNVSGSNGLVTATRTVSASYFYPYSSHQLSVLRKSPTLIIDLDSENELPDSTERSSDGQFILLPEHTHPAIKENLDYWLEKAGYKTK